MSLTEMRRPEYSGPRHDEIRRQQNRPAKVPPPGVNLNGYQGMSDQTIVVAAEVGAVFIHRRSGTLYFFQDETGRFEKAYA